MARGNETYVWPRAVIFTGSHQLARGWLFRDCRGCGVYSERSLSPEAVCLDISHPFLQTEGQDFFGGVGQAFEYLPPITIRPQLPARSQVPRVSSGAETQQGLPRPRRGAGTCLGHKDAGPSPSLSETSQPRQAGSDTPPLSRVHLRKTPTPQPRRWRPSVSGRFPSPLQRLRLTRKRV